MQQETLRATERVTSGSMASRRLRRDGRTPAVVYGTTIDTRAVHVEQRDLYGVLRTEAGLNAVIELDIDGSTMLAIAREIQRDPISGVIAHLDFIEVRLDTEIDAEVEAALSALDDTAVAGVGSGSDLDAYLVENCDS